jgi:hypothetical protein
MSASAQRPRTDSFLPIDWFGPLVTLVRTLMDGTETREALPVALAVYQAQFGIQNGRTVVRARVEFGGIRDSFRQSG